jgi:hypothetical protein
MAFLVALCRFQRDHLKAAILVQLGKRL